jgi:precorrin-6B methylase 2
MKSLRRDMVLLRHPDLVLRLDADNQLQAVIAGRDIPCGEHGLAVLQAFSRPRSVDEALQALDAKGRHAWMELTETVLLLYRRGALCDGAEIAMPAGEPAGYAGWSVHFAMLNDRARTAAFLAGIAANVRPGDVVVDLGTGTGVLAVAAARAGARHVYALEASGIASLARQVIAANGLEDRITVIEDWSTKIELPEPADVVVSEMIGHDPLGERVLELTLDAVERLARPGARLVPERLRLFALSLEVSEEERQKRMPTMESVARWHDWYGVDLSPLAAQFSASEAPLAYVRPQTAAAWPPLAEPVLLLDRDLGAAIPPVVESRVTVQAKSAGTLSGVLLYFELDLGPGTVFSTHPRHAAASNHWWSPIWLPKEPLHLVAGGSFVLHYQYGLLSRGSRLRVQGA